MLPVANLWIDVSTLMRHEGKITGIPRTYRNSWRAWRRSLVCM